MTLKLNFLSFFDERSRWSLWFPVFMAVGITAAMAELWISVYFSLFLVFLCAVGVKNTSLLRVVVVMPVLGLLCGYGSYQTYVWLNQTQSLSNERYVRDLEATILEVDIATYGTRLLVELTQKTQDRVKQKINRVRLTHRVKQAEPLMVGQQIRAQVVLTPFSGPLIPNGFDFRQNSAYQAIGASGYTVKPIEITGQSHNSWHVFWQKMRLSVTQDLLAVPSSNPQLNAIAVALITGQKGMLHEQTRQAFAASGLAHVLAISGLHMNLMAGIVFLFIKFIFCRFPWVLERIHLPKLAAFLTFLALIGYLMISGQAVSALRAFIMAAFVLWGIILGREGISMRFVALAATVILMFKPYSFLLPSFQMSFFVVMALVAFYESCFGLIGLPGPSWIGQFWHQLKGIFASSVLASFVILPFSIYHFHTVSLQSVLANLVVIPLLGLTILPGLLLGVVLKSTLGFDFVLQGTYWMIGWVYDLSFQVKQWPGAIIHLPHPPTWSFLVCVFGLLWLCIWQQKWRFFGAILLILGLILMILTPKPSCFELKDKAIYVCKIGDKVYTNAKRTSTFTIKYLAHALGVSETQLQRTHLSKQALMEKSFNSATGVVGSKIEEFNALK